MEEEEEESRAKVGLYPRVRRKGPRAADDGPGDLGEVPSRPLAEVVDSDLYRADVDEADAPGKVGGKGGKDERVVEGEESGRRDELEERQHSDEAFLAPPLLHLSSLSKYDDPAEDSDEERTDRQAAQRPGDALDARTETVAEVDFEAGRLRSVRDLDKTYESCRFEVGDDETDCRNVDVGCHARGERDRCEGK